VNASVIVASLFESVRFPPLRIALFVCAGFMALTLITATGIWWPAHREHEAAQLDLEEKTQQLVLLIQADDIGRAYRSTLETVPRLEKKLSLDMSQAELVNILGKLASRSGARLLAQSFDERKVQQGPPIMTVELSLEGPYVAVRGFMLGLSGLSVWCEVEDMRLERAREGAGLIRAQMHLIVYRKVAPPSGGNHS
jgi:Tfp pilus assembly protein PilO